ncbi:MAG: nitroreductase family protein [Clostridiales bacterium]|nr:nitroreductase family protein [Clostridiales bacterium]
MFSKVRSFIKIRLDRIKMFGEFYNDYRHYKKWNYHNPKVKTRAAQESKILRQTHMIEKGMSLSKPRKGFGQAKIAELFEMLDGYLKLGFSPSAIPFQNAVIALNEYVIMQKNMGYENSELNEKLSNYQKYLEVNNSAGIIKDTKQNIEEQAHKEYPVFFNSRHSMRQFRPEKVKTEDIKAAVCLVQKAPTACNRQASRVYFYKDEKTNCALGELISGNTGFDGEVNNYLVITADVSAFYDSFERNQIYVEAGIFAMALVEAMHYYGIGSCVLQNGEYKKKNKKFKKICGNIPENERIILFAAVGYYKDEFTYAASMRKNIDDVLIISEN